MMKRLIDAFIAKFWCCHEWEMYKECNVYKSDTDTMPYMTKQTLVCEKCGEIKRIEI